MTKEEICALPAATAIGLLYECVVNGRELESMEAPRPPQSPKFDHRIRRKDGCQWASETDLEGLRFWHNRAIQPGDPKWADKNEKEARSLLFFIKWREANPNALWQGERNHEQFTAKPASSKPTVHSWEPRASDTDPAPAGEPEYDSELPF